MFALKSLKLHKKIVVLVATVAVVGVLAATVLAMGNMGTQSPMLNFSDATVIANTESTLVRTDDAVTMWINTRNLDNKAVYTVWWVIFNNPDACTHPAGGGKCGEGDLLPNHGDPAVNSSVLWAAGSIVQGNKATFVGYLEEGDDSRDLLFGLGLIEASTAEIHLVVKSHGEPIPGYVAEQLTTFGGGCTPETSGPQPGLVGGNDCVDQQASVHVAP